MKRKMMFWSLILLLLVPGQLAFADKEKSLEQVAEQVIEPRYLSILKQWNEVGQDNAQEVERVVAPTDFLSKDENSLLSGAESKEYGEQVYAWGDQDVITIEVEVDEDGLYELGFDYYPLGEGIVPIEGSIQVNGEFPYYESRRIIFPKDWKSATNDFEQDRFGDEIIPAQMSVEKWHFVKAEDSSYLHSRPLKYELKKGKNTITLTNLRGEMLLGNVYVNSVGTIPTYEEYQKKHEGNLTNAETVTVEAEHPSIKNSSFIRPVNRQDASVVPYKRDRRLLNALGGDSWQTSGQQASWEIEVEEAGYYQISLKVLQEKQTGFPVFRTVMINGEVPFEEVEHYSFEQEKNWVNETLSNENEEPLLFYLNKGKNTLTLKVDASPVNTTLFEMDQVMRGIEELSLSIKRLTGNNQDRSRGWRITEYMPEIEEKLSTWADNLEAESEYLLELSNGRESVEIVSLQIAVERLRELAADPDKIPARLTQLSEGSSSVAQLLGKATLDLKKQPLIMDRLYIHGDDALPKPELGFFAKTKESILKFFHSFQSNTLATEKVDDDVVEVWVNRPRQYVELMQNMADQNFTPETGIKVRFSIMPSEQKLILANAANSQPDLALGISSWLPYELAIRDAAYDLRQFDDFDDTLGHFSPGAFLPMMIDDQVYGIPETQDFFVQFYRKDIMNALDIPVPDTWDDVVNVLPELQRFGLNYYTPIAGAVAFKPFQATSPFIYQHQGDLYEEDGMGTTINSDETLRGIQLMTDLNTIYSTPLQVPNFYNHFRYSTLPIGVSNFQTYVELTSAAPELSGWWDISPHPGVKQENGTVERWATGSGQSGMIFNGSKNKDEAWELLKWWMSTETQTDFATTLQIMYGPSYMWNTANLDAFKQLPWPEEHKEVILKQWEYLKEVPKTPYTYMVEREISNVWNRVVFDGENTRSAVDDAVVTINREMRRKMEEFGYMKDGKVVKPYHIPTIEQVESWVEENEE
ncbi:Bacterial extracellular solute-binding protein [Bacillus sp. THAF10]|uniref:extracellular solute-binding protein n=1 Tax=Bacillus sp. THAF10 TaxID=2587848 RepID=UPI0012A9A64C|nr:extracellular solute-binding protein [Bacillus sp. THAF10]QFT90537.1 Bacterial extracellular solute-binding protein [Bacillus sp. THAF10]